MEILLRGILRLYPRTFRERFGDEMLRDARAELERGSEGNLGSALGVRLRLVADQIRGVRIARQHGRAHARHAAATGAERAMESGGGRGKMTVETIRNAVRDFGRDLKFSVRSLLRAPAFSAVAVLTLGVGIGSASGILGVVDTVLLKPLPYGRPDRVVTVWSSWVGFPKTWVSVAEYRAYLNRVPSLEDAALWGEGNVTFTSAEAPEQVVSVTTTPNLAEVLQIDMTVGRFFTRADAEPADSTTYGPVVLSHEVWTRRYASDPAITSRAVQIGGVQRPVIGVLPAGFRLPTQFGTSEVADVYLTGWVPREANSSFPSNGGSHSWYVVGRMVPGASVETVRRDVNGAIEQIRSEFSTYGPERRFQPLVYLASDDVVGGVRPAILALLGTVGLVLLIACTNVANLMLVRGRGRRTELAVRSALGAGEGRIVRAVLAEGLVLALLGGAVGIGFAAAGIRLVQALSPGNLPRLDEVAMNGTVLGVAVGLSVVTVLLAGGIPAWRVVRRRWTGLARGSVADIPSVRGQNALVVGQLALAVVLTVGAGLMFRSLGAYTTIDTGFTAEDALTLKVALPGGIYSSPDAASGFHAEALRRISETPGVLRAAGARILPLASQIGDWGVRIEGYAAPPDFPTNGDWQYATPGYFEAMGIPLVRGRTFEAGDDAAAAGALVVNEAFVRHFWPEGDVDPIGRRVQLGGGGDVPFMTIVGVVGDVTHNGLTAEIKRKFYVPVAQWGIATTNAPNTLRYVVTTAGDPMALLEPVRAIIRDLDPTLAVAEVRTLDQIRGSAVAQPRFVAAVSAIFAGIALLLSLVGIYGVVSYGVSQRVREFGVRMALGAEQGRVISLTLRRHVPTVAFGLTLGFALSFALTRYVESLLFGVGPFDPLTYAAVVTTFLGVATMGALMPAIRASRVDPARVLREE